jgi:hypothetical protein
MALNKLGKEPFSAEELNQEGRKLLFSTLAGNMDVKSTSSIHFVIRTILQFLKIQIPPKIRINCVTSKYITYKETK